MLDETLKLGALFGSLVAANVGVTWMLVRVLVPRLLQSGAEDRAADRAARKDEHDGFLRTLDGFRADHREQGAAFIGAVKEERAAATAERALDRDARHRMGTEINAAGNAVQRLADMLPGRIAEALRVVPCLRGEGRET